MYYLTTIELAFLYHGIFSSFRQRCKWSFTRPAWFRFKNSMEFDILKETRVLLTQLYGVQQPNSALNIYVNNISYNVSSSITFKR